MNVVRLRALSELCTDTVSQINPRRKPEREFWYIDISAVDNSIKRIASPQKMRGEHASVRARQVIHTNDVLVSTTRPNLNAIALVPDQFDGEVCSTGFCVLRVSSQLHPDYLYYFAQSKAFIDPLVDLTRGALYPAVTDRQVLGQKIPWVSVEQQSLIAARLKEQLTLAEMARQAAVNQHQDIIALRRLLLADIFTGIDAPSKVLSQFAPTTSGSTPSRGVKEYWQPAEIPWVKTGEVNFSMIMGTEEAISQRALAECSLTLLPQKTVLVAMYGQGKTRGQSAILEIPATTNQACFAILPNDTWEPEFLFYWLMASYEKLRTLSADRGGNQANLNGELLNALKVPAPDKSEQRKVARQIKIALSEISGLEAASNAALRDIEQLPNCILAKAFEK